MVSSASLSFMLAAPSFRSTFNTNATTAPRQNYHRTVRIRMSDLSSPPPLPPLLDISPLRDAHVLFTCPPVYAPRLSASLLFRSARPHHMPTISTQPLPSDDDIMSIPLHSAILTLSDFDVIAFPSRSAILHFAHALQSALPSMEGMSINPTLILKASGVRIAALGADAIAVREFLQTEPDIVPPSATPAALAQLLAADTDMHNKKVLVPIPVVVGMREPDVIPDFLQMLRDDAGCIVTDVPAYVTKPVPCHRLRIELDMLQRREIDAIVLSSIGEAFALHALLDERDGLLNAVLDMVHDGTLVLAAHGPVTAKGVRHVFGLDGDGDGDDVLVVSKDWSSFDGVVLALENLFVNRIKDSGKLLIAD